jgi:acetyltransferase-like isoleucine patch superfamily enzyme
MPLHRPLSILLRARQLSFLALPDGAVTGVAAVPAIGIWVRLAVSIAIPVTIAITIPIAVTITCVEVGDDSWIGEDVWIDNLATVTIGANCCISQGAYICTGSHDWSSPAFGLVTKPVRIEDCAWVAARAVVGPGVVVGEGAVLSLGAMASTDLQPWSIYAGVPASLVGQRRIRPGRARSSG